MLPHYRLSTAGVQLSFAGRVEAEDEVSLGIPDSRQANRKQWQAGRSGAARTSSGEAGIQNELNALRQASRLKGHLTQTLLGQGWITCVNFKVATQGSRIALA